MMSRYEGVSCSFWARLELRLGGFWHKDKRGAGNPDREGRVLFQPGHRILALSSSSRFWVMVYGTEAKGVPGEEAANKDQGD